MKLKYLGQEYEVRFVKGKYAKNGNLFLGIQNMGDEGVWEDFCDVTINFPDACAPSYGYLNLPDMNGEIYALIRPFITDGGKVMQSNQFSYPLVCFSKELLDMAVALEA